MTDDPTSIPTERMPELAADIRLILAVVDYLAEIVTYRGQGDGSLNRRRMLEYSLQNERDQDDALAAYDRLSAAFGKDE
jgi:hypothetical protein